MTNATFQVFETADETFRWRLRIDDGTVVATSDRSHETKVAALREVQRLKRVAVAAGVESIDR